MEKFNNWVCSLDKERFVLIMLIPFIIAIFVFGFFVGNSLKDVNTTNSNIILTKKDIENNLLTDPKYLELEEFKVELRKLDDELSSFGLDIRDLKREYQWDYILSLVSENFNSPKILEFTDEFIIFSSEELFGDVFRQIKKFELDRLTASIDYMFYNSQNQTYVIKILRKV